MKIRLLAILVFLCFEIKVFAQQDSVQHLLPLFESDVMLKYAQGKQEGGNSYVASGLGGSLQFSLSEHFLIKRKGKAFQIRDFIEAEVQVGIQKVATKNEIWMPYSFGFGPVIRWQLLKNHALGFKMNFLKAGYDQILPFMVGSNGVLIYANHKHIFEIAAETRYERFLQWIPGLLQQKMQIQYWLKYRLKLTNNRTLGIYAQQYKDAQTLIEPESQWMFQILFGKSF